MVSSQNNAPVRLSNIQALRGAAALLVTLTHLYLMELEQGGQTLLPSFFKLGYVGVDLFFVISGFIMVYVTHSTKAGLKNSASFLFARAGRIYPIYWLIALVLLIIWRIHPSVLTYDTSQSSLLKSFVLWPDKTLPMLSVAWTLIHEMYFYLVFAIILLAPPKWRMALLGVWTLGLGVGALQDMTGQSPELRLVTNPLNLEFSLGAFAAWVFLKSGGTAGKLALVLGLLGWIGSYVYQLGFSSNEYPSFLSRVWLFGLPGMLITYGLAATEVNGRNLPKWTETFGNWSYSLYLTHLLVLSALGFIWSRYATGGGLKNAVILPLCLLITIATSWIVYKFAEKPLIDVAKTLRRKLFTPQPPQHH